MPRIARSFDLMNRSLNRAQLIEVLSSPELLNFEGYEEDQSDLFVSGEEDHSVPQTRDNAETASGKTGADDEEAEERLSPEATKLVEDETDSEEEDRDPILSGFHKSRTVQSWSQREVEDGEPKDSLNAIFQAEEDAPESEFLVAEDEEDENGEEAELKMGTGRDEETSNGPPPMWERFLDPEPKAEINQRENEEAEDDVVEEAEEGFIDEPILDLTEDDGPDLADLKQMHRLLADGKSQFVKKIFRGSVTAYENAISELATMKDWGSASRYVEKEIFKRNLVDMYSETAVDFTDRLQTYFIKATKSNRS